MSCFFTIVIATYNAEEHLARLLGTLAEQSCRSFEVLVSDGASTDNTLTILKQYAPELPKLVLRSAPDNGVYDAWEKILPTAEGQWILFLGADDALMDAGVLTKAREKLQAVSDTIYFGLGHLVYMTPEGEETNAMLLYPDGSRALLPYMNPMGHAAIFHRRSFMSEHSFDTSFRILGDYDFFCKYWRDEYGIALNFPVAKVALGGLSNSPRWMAINHLESRRIRKKYFPREYYAGAVLNFAGTVKKFWRENALLAPSYSLLRQMKRFVRR